jgi:anti-repressor protein
MGGRDLMAGVATMTSREIAELVESRHDKVKQSIERLAARGLIAQPPMGDEQFDDAMGRSRKEAVYHVGKRDSYVVVAQLSPEFTARLVDRWQELEAAAAVPALALPDFTNPAIAARAWAEQFEAKLALSAQIVTDAPKVAFAEAIRSIDGVCHIEKVAKTIGIGRNKFFKRLRDDGILMRSNLPYQKYIDRDYFTVNEQEPYTDKEGVKHPTFTAMVTGAGQVFLVRKYSPSAL